MGELRKILIYYFILLTNCNCVRFTNKSFRYSMANNKYSSNERLLDESGVYFKNLLKERVNTEGLSASDLKYFENVKNQLANHYSLTLLNYVNNKFKNINFLFNSNNTGNNGKTDSTNNTDGDNKLDSTNRTDSDKEVNDEQQNRNSQMSSEVDMNENLVKLCKIYENSVVSTLLLYLQLTEDALSKSKKQSFEEERLRMFVELYNSLYNKIYSVVGLNVNNLKMYYINYFFENQNTKSVPLVVGSYSKNLNSLIPNVLKFNNINSLLSFYNIKLKVSSENENLSLSKNSLVNELKFILTNIQKHAKSDSADNAGKSGPNKNLMKVISNQQNKIEQYNKLISNKAGGSRLNYVFTYRIPHTNLTLTTSYIK
uniref:Uncharacterized protein n=1 Tax=Theileria annulata TaxID=5874 RepID=A0A3B0MKL7_THEAN